MNDLKDLPNLSGIDLGGSGIGDAGIIEIAKVRKLKTVDLSSTSMTDKGLATLSQVKTLTWINVRYTKVTRAGCEGFRKALPNCEVFGSPPK